MSATLTTVNGILKEVYEGQINDQLANEQTLLKRVIQTSDGTFENAGGKYVVFPVRTKRNHGISYRSENALLADAGAQGYAATQENLKYGYGRVRLTGQVMELARTNPQAFAVAADQEMSGLKEDLARDSNRIAWGHNDEMAASTGILSKITAGATSATITAPVTSVIEVGMVVDVTDNAGTPVASGTGLTVTAAVIGATSFTVSGSTTHSSGGYIVRTGNYGKEPHGMLGLVDSSGTLHNINSATAGNEYWRSTEDATTTTLTEGAMIANCDAVRRAGGKRISAIFCSLGVRRAYFNLMTGLRRYNEVKEFSGGLVGLSFNYGKEIPVVEDLDAPDSTMIGLTESEIKVYKNKDWYWADDDGSVMKYVHNYDAWEALMKCYWQVVTHQRNAHFKMTTITEG